MHLLVFSNAAGRRQRQLLSRLVSSSGYPSREVPSVISHPEEVPVQNQDTVSLITVLTPLSQADLDSVVHRLQGTILGALRVNLGTG